MKKTTGLKVMNTKGKNLVVRYSKVSGAKGYQITYATNSKFTKGKKVVNTTKRTKTIQKLKKERPIMYGFVHIRRIPQAGRYMVSTAQ